MKKKSVNSDIYNLAELVDDVKKTYLPDETEQTLAVGLYGYIGAIESKRLQTQVRMTGELCNESFPSRARLERSIITHAIMANIEDINAIPAKMNALIAVKESEISDSLNHNNEFILDREIPIYLGDFEFHLEYDVIIKKIFLPHGSGHGRDVAYTAQYDMSRINPSSKISNPFLSTPFVIMENHQAYINITVIVSQVEHNKIYSKLVTSNVIDNKTINFEFENELSYFEVHSKESDSDYWLTPIFEGSAVPNGVNYYCWYQYIDQHLIRVRFDRNSYMPGLNAQVEVLFKTTHGEGGNFTYTEQEYINLQSEKYGYKGLTGLFTPLSDSKDGKNRKSKKMLQGLIPKELLARGSYTTITDLNNYFGMLDSEYGRIVIQKKIDNQQERVYYAYLVLKDSDMNVIPSNTIDVKIRMDQLIESKLNDFQAPRYVLKPGNMIRIGADGVGYISDEPLVSKGLSYQMQPIARGKYAEVTIKATITDNSYKNMSASALVGDTKTPVLTMPDNGSTNAYIIENDNEFDLEDYCQVSAGQLCSIIIDNYNVENDGETIDVENTFPDNFKFINAFYTIGEETKVVESLYISNNKFKIPGVKKGKYKLKINGRVLYSSTNHVSINVISKVSKTTASDSGVDPVTKSITFYTPVITADRVPTSLTAGDVITYKVKYLSISNSYSPIVRINLSRGLDYSIFNSKISYQDGDTFTTIEPSIKDITEENGFIYTNPYAIVVNKFRLYSAFYMMSLTENPYLHFDYINQKSIVQFISTNIRWSRAFLGVNKDKYILKVTLSQSAQEDIGLIPKPAHSGDPEIPIVKCIAVFYRDKRPYRYRTLKLVSFDKKNYSYDFVQEFDAIDTLDNDNNIRVQGAEVVGQPELASTVNQYGYFNPNTELKIYALCAKPDIENGYTRYGLDGICPGLDIDSEGKQWTVTNMFNVVNGINFYHNYSEIMGSRVIPFGNTDWNGKKQPILDTGGYIVKSVPVFGYDYCQDEFYIQKAIDTLNARKAYIDNTLVLLENSFNIDFKFFNTYGKSKIYYVIKDSNANNILDDKREYIDRVNLTFYFRVKLLVSGDSYTKNRIIKEIKEYIENLADISDLHIPNLITQITTNYKEQVTYFEYLGFNKYGPDIQHIYKEADNKINIHDAPEFLNINNVKSTTNELVPDINIYLSEN